MPDQATSLVEPPSSGDPTIWRYMDFAKFVAMLVNGGLHFSRADLFIDRFEGAFTQRSIDKLRESRPDASRDEIKRWVEIERNIRKHSIVSCWSLGEVESASLWKNNDLVIRSSYNRLRSFLPEECDINRDEYIDYGPDCPAITHPLGALRYKRKEFAGENELRAIGRWYFSDGTKEVPYEGARLE